MSERTVKKVMQDLAATGLTVEQQALIGELILSASRYSVHHHYGEEVTPGAQRVRRHRERKEALQSVTNVTENGDGVLVDNNKLDLEKNNTPPSPRSVLKTILDDERTQAVIEHRKRLRKPLTSHAAKLLAAELKKAPDPNAAADVMIARGWIGFNPEWLKDRPPKGNVTRFRVTEPPRPYAEIKAERDRA